MFDGKWPSSEEVIRATAGKHRRIQIAFSGGKDSVCSYLACRGHFEEIRLVHYYLIPGLEFVERGIRYYEKLWGVEIIRVPGPWIYKMLNHGVFQTWSNWNVIDLAGLPRGITYNTIRAGVAETRMGMDPDECWIGVGTRATDSVTRNMRFRKFGPVHEGNKTFYPIWDWDKARVVRTIKESGVKLPEEYHVFGRTFDALSQRFLAGIKRHWPDDWNRILEFFPLAEAEILRYEWAEKRRKNRG